MNFINPKIIFQWQNYLLIRKYTSLEITKTVKVKNVVLLIAKKIWSKYEPSVQKHFPSLQKYVKTIVLVLFQWIWKHWNKTSAIFWKVIFRTRNIFRWGLPDFLFRYGCYIQAVIVFQCFFCGLPHRFCHRDLFTFQKFCACVDNTFLVPNESAWHSLERQQEIMVWSSSLHKERLICISISRFISLIIFQLQLLWTRWIFTSYFVISKNFCMFLFKRFRFWAPTCFLEVICPSYNLGRYTESTVGILNQP